MLTIVILTDKEEKQLFKRVVRKIKAMSMKERLRTMEHAGIYTKSGQLTEEYGGPRQKKKKRRKQSK
jgi:hypothetical protein